jgi:hypothetical protein
MRDAVCKDSGLSRTRPGNYKERFGTTDGEGLIWVETSEAVKAASWIGCR